MSPKSIWTVAGTIFGLLFAGPLAAQAQTGTVEGNPATLSFGAESTTERAVLVDAEPAQEVTPEETASKASEVMPSAKEEPIAVQTDGSPSELAECLGTADSLRAVIEKGLNCPDPSKSPDLLQLGNDLDNCRADDRQNRTTNQRLHSELKACLEDTGPSPAEKEALEKIERERDAAREELVVLKAMLEEANEKVAALTERLESFGFGAEPGFRYIGSRDASYMRRDRADTNLPGELKLPVERCGDALAWLDEQTESDDHWLRKIVWVWNEGSEVLLCKPVKSGGFETTPASPSDEAHAIIFE